MTDWVPSSWLNCARCGVTLRRGGNTKANQCCADCRETDPDYCAALMDTEAITHGITGYNHYGCRCRTCCDAKTDYARRGQPPKRDRAVTHGETRYSRYGCRCDLCRAAHAARRRKQRATPTKPQPADPPVCGAMSGYRAGCRCDACRGANAERARNQRATQRQQAAADTWTHGRAAYTNLGCRCDTCTQAAADYRAQNREEDAA